MYQFSNQREFVVFRQFPNFLNFFKNSWLFG
jgi:hypothetical protein